MEAMQVATIGQLELGLDDAIFPKRLVLNATAEIAVLHGRQGSALTHEAPTVE
jgi:hypothetical protein